MSGIGVYMWINGEIYKGEILENMIHGIGSFLYKSGNLYSGSWF